jgi:HEAT repeat protein
VEIWARIALMDQDQVSEIHILAIAKHLKSPKAQTRAHAARALGGVGPHARSRVADLTALLQDKDHRIIMWAAWALGQIGEGAQSALPALEPLTRHEQESVKVTAQEAIDQIKTQTQAKGAGDKGGGAEKQNSEKQGVEKQESEEQD